MNAAGSTITSGIKTREQLDDTPYGHAVEWIDWDSDFRSSGLQCQDLILGVNGKDYLKENRDRESARAIGNYLESTFWAEQGGVNGQIITLSVYRDGQRLSIKGKIQEQSFYVNAENRQTLGLNGPVRLANDGFASAWAGWYEKFMRHASLYLTDRRWIRSHIDNRKVLAEHMEWHERVVFLVKKYPGRFAENLLLDWEEVRKVLEGNTYTDINAEKLEYRKLGEQRAELVKEAAVKGYNEFVEKAADRMMDAFPVVDVVHGDISAVAGKMVLLPQIGFEQFINDLGKSFAVIGSAQEGYYFIHLNSPEMDMFFLTLFYYKAQVTPEVKEQFQFIAELTQVPAILRYNGRTVTGLMVKVIAGMAGDHNVFINTGKPAGEGRARFEGEEALSLFASHPLNNNAAPREVIESMISCIKLGDMNAWKKLFCSWRIFAEAGSAPYMNFMYWHREESYQHVWEQSRRQILNDVFDARVLYVAPVKTILEEKAGAGIPQVEQVMVIVDHIGRFEGVYKSVCNIYLHRKWVLQRLNSGPWRIAELQAL